MCCTHLVDQLQARAARSNTLPDTVSQELGLMRRLKAAAMPTLELSRFIVACRI